MTEQPAQKDSRFAARVLRLFDWMTRHPLLVFAVLSAACLVFSFGLHHLIQGGLAQRPSSLGRPPVYWQTLRMPVLIFRNLGVLFLLFALLVRWKPLTEWNPRALLIGWVILAAACRWATPDLALDLAPKPDALHYAALSSHLLQGEGWTVPVGPNNLPSRFSPGTSIWILLSQWIRPDHPGYGVGAIWLAALLTIGWLGFAGKRLISPRVGIAAALLLAASPAYGFYSRLVMSEVPWSLFVLVAWLLLFASHVGCRGRLAGGFVLGLAMLFKPPHIVMVGAAGMGFLFYLFGDLQVRWREGLAAFCGVLLGVLPVLVYNQVVLGDWLLSGYQIHDSNHYAVSAVFGLHYLWDPPMFKGVIGNMFYYPLTIFGLDPRVSRMLFALPVSLLILLGLLLRSGVPRTSDEAAARQPWLIRSGWILLLANGLFYMPYAYQDSRFFLPVLPVACLLIAMLLEPVLNALRSEVSSFLQVLFLLAFMACGSAIAQVEWEGLRPHRSEQWTVLAESLQDVDLLLSDEDPVALGWYGAWNESTPLIPVMGTDGDWYGRTPEQSRKETGSYMQPFPGLGPILDSAVRDGEVLRVWLSNPRGSLRWLEALSDEWEWEAIPSNLDHLYSFRRKGRA